MSKKEQNRKAASPKKKNSLLDWLVAVGVGASLVLAVVFLFPKSQPWGLPAIPHNPRPATLSPDLFAGKVAETYRIAREAPDLLERMPCYCGCYVTAARRNNLDCYTDRHAVG